MSFVIRRCPFYSVATQVEVAGREVDVRPYQIILWVSIRLDGTSSRHFPAILDLGHSLNFSIKEEQLRDWAGISLGRLKPIGRTTLNGRRVILSRANVNLHRNMPAHRDRLLVKPPLQLTLPEGIVVHPLGDPFSPRLPLLGLRAFVHNQLKMTVDGKRLSVSVGRGFFS